MFDAFTQPCVLANFSLLPSVVREMSSCLGDVHCTRLERKQRPSGLNRVINAVVSDVVVTIQPGIVKTRSFLSQQSTNHAAHYKRLPLTSQEEQKVTAARNRARTLR